jgi:glycerol-3-phosphate dehydrogenase (NAD(P)+)
MRAVLQQIKPFILDSHLLIFVNKGIEADTLMLPNDVVCQELGDTIGHKSTFLSGPSFAIEVVKHAHTAVSRILE